MNSSNAAVALFGGGVMLLVWLGLYVFSAFCLQTIAVKTNTENPWLAWIPIANVYLMLKVAGMPWWWLLVMLIPLIQLVPFVMMFYKMAEARGKSGVIGLLMLVPVLNLIILGYLAFSE